MHKLSYKVRIGQGKRCATESRLECSTNERLNSQPIARTGGTPSNDGITLQMRHSTTYYLLQPWKSL